MEKDRYLTCVTQKNRMSEICSLIYGCITVVFSDIKAYIDMLRVRCVCRCSLITFYQNMLSGLRRCAWLMHVCHSINCNGMGHSFTLSSFPSFPRLCVNLFLFHLMTNTNQDHLCILTCAQSHRIRKQNKATPRDTHTHKIREQRLSQ